MPATITSIYRDVQCAGPASPQASPFRTIPAPRRHQCPVLVFMVLVAVAGERRPSLPISCGFVLYALTAADLTVLAALVFVLARNIIKLLVERRRGLPFARFRASWCAAVRMTLVSHPGVDRRRRSMRASTAGSPRDG